ncbi:CoB--CoM heterodisulfide reductase iron-sulfur subunit B family protein [Candidatus Neomarinimicrobiota bacterium]
MKYLYYPGCSLEHSARGYDESVRFVFQKLGHDLVELDDWNCCGATYYMSIKETISLVYSARNLALAEAYGGDLVAPCSSCYTILYKTHKVLKDNPVLLAKVNQALKKDDLEYNLSVRVRHPLEVLVNDIGLDQIAADRQADLNGMKIAPYYGCQIVRPERYLDDTENPMMMDRLLSALGSEVTYFPMKVRCCGGMLMITSPEVALELNRDLLASAVENGAECIATTCPLCQMNLEAYQKRINRMFSTRFRVPIVYFTQLVGLALGGSPDELGLTRNLIPLQAALQ